MQRLPYLLLHGAQWGSVDGCSECPATVLEVLGEETCTSFPEFSSWGVEDVGEG